ncbi:MAG: hypothetical protein ACOC58_00315 [Chloroflexota bacterium]
MRRFDAQVKVFVLDQRHSGKAWKQVQEEVRATFKIDPPSLRAMENWAKDLDREALSRLMVEEVRQAPPNWGPTALQHVAAGLIPVLWQTKDAGQDIELQGWLWFFSLAERQMGTATFERVLSEYMRRPPEIRIGVGPVPWLQPVSTSGDAIL